MTSNIRLDVGDDPDHDAGPGIFEGIFATARQGQLCEFLLITPKVVDEL